MLAFIIILSCPMLAAAATTERKLVEDSVLASVNGDPITVLDLVSRYPSAKNLSVKEIAADHAARAVLDAMILERLVIEEAKARGISTTNDEVQRYVNEIAKRNGLTQEGFKAALEKEKRSYEQYLEQIRIDILRSKLVSGLVRNERGVSKREIQEYIEANPSFSSSGAKLKLSQILVARTLHTEDEAKEIMNTVKAELEEGESFPELAKKYSDGPEGADGGTLGVLAEEDLSSTIFDAVFSLQDGQISDIVESESGLHIFRVDGRFVTNDEEPDESLYAEVREKLARQKVEEKLHEYFSVDLYKIHAVEKKI